MKWLWLVALIVLMYCLTKSKEGYCPCGAA
jgi:hypothetical protein